MTNVELQTALKIVQDARKLHDEIAALRSFIGSIYRRPEDRLRLSIYGTGPRAGYGGCNVTLTKDTIRRTLLPGLRAELKRLEARWKAACVKCTATGLE